MGNSIPTATEQRISDRDSEMASLRFLRAWGIIWGLEFGSRSKTPKTAVKFQSKLKSSPQKVSVLQLKYLVCLMRLSELTGLAPGLLTHFHVVS